MADWNWVDLVNLALAGYQTYNNTRGPKFKDPGLTPEQQQLYNLFFKSLTNPALANNAGDVSNYGRSILGGYSNLGWQSPKTHSGETGYPGHAPVNFDWSKLTGAPTTTPPPNTTTPGAGTSPGLSSIPGDPFGHLAAPAGSQGDPFGFWPAPSTSGGTTPDGGGGGISAFLQQHPQIFAQGAGAAAGLLASMLGIPGPIASMLVNRFMQHNNQPSTLPLTHNDTSADNLRPAGAPPPGGQSYDMRPPAPITYTSRDPGGMYDPGHGISAGIVQPEGQGHGQGGFGAGWGIDQFYQGGADNEMRRLMHGAPQRSFLGAGQRV